MRTGAIFARGSCRALKWMALVGVVFALGAGQALAQATAVTSATIGNVADDYSLKIMLVTMDDEVWGSTPAGSFQNGAGNVATGISGLAAASPGATTFKLTFPYDVTDTAGLTYTQPPEDSGHRLLTADGADSGTEPDEVATITAAAVTVADTAPILPDVSTGDWTGPFPVGEALPATGTADVIELPEVEKGGNEPFTYSLTNLPTGLSFAPNSRELTGTPASGTAGTHNIIYRVTDTAVGAAAAHEDVGRFTLTVGPVPTTTTTTNLSNGVLTITAENPTEGGGTNVMVTLAADVEPGMTTKTTVTVAVTANSLMDAAELAALGLGVTPAEEQPDQGSPIQNRDFTFSDSDTNLEFVFNPHNGPGSRRQTPRPNKALRLQTATTDTDAEDEGVKLTASISAGELAALDDATHNIKIMDAQEQTYDLVPPTTATEAASFTATLEAKPPHYHGSRLLTVNLDTAPDGYVVDVAIASGDGNMAAVNGHTVRIGGPSHVDHAGNVTAEKATITITPPGNGNDGNREDDALVLAAYSGAVQRWLEDSERITVVDSHKLPAITATLVNSGGTAVTGTVMEGNTYRLTLSTAAAATENLMVMLTPTEDSTADPQDDYSVMTSFTIDTGETQSETFDLEVDLNDDLENESLKFNARVTGEAMYGTMHRDQAELLSLTIMDGTAKLVRPADGAEAAINAAIAEAKARNGGRRASDKLNRGENIIIEKDALFTVESGSGYTVRVDASSSDDDVVWTNDQDFDDPSGAEYERIWLSVGDVGTTTITITGTGIPPSSVVSAPGRNLTPEIAEITFPLTVELAPPAEPADLEASAGDPGEVILTWDGTTDFRDAHRNDEAETYEWDMDASGDWQPTDTTSSHTVTGLTDGQRYIFRVRSKNSAGVSEGEAVEGTPQAAPLGPQVVVKSVTTATSVPESGGLTVTVTATVPAGTKGSDGKVAPIASRHLYVWFPTDHASIADGEEAEDADLTVLGDQVWENIPRTEKASEAKYTFRVAIGQDLDAEDEKFQVEVEIDGGDGKKSDVVTIDDAQEQTYVLSLPSANKGAIKEGAPATTLTLTAKPEKTFDIPVTLALNPNDPSKYTLGDASGTFGTSAFTSSIAAKADSDRENDTITVTAYTAAAGNLTSLDITVTDANALPAVKATLVDDQGKALAPQPESVKEGETVKVMLTVVDKDGKTIKAAEKLSVSLMPTGTADSSDYRLASHPIEIASGKESSAAVDLMVTEDQDVGEETLMFDAAVAGEDKNGTEKRSVAGVLSLMIEDATQKLVYAKPQEEVEAAIYAAKTAGAGDDMTFTKGEMIEVMGNALFSSAEGVTVSYTAESDMSNVASASVSGGTVMVTAAAEGMAHITITAHASMPSGVQILDQTDPGMASIMFPVEVGLEALSIELMGPEDMNLAEGMSAMVTATASREVTGDVTVMLMRDRAMSSAGDADFTAEAIVIEAGMMTGSTMVMAVEDNMAEDMEELVLYGMTEGMAGEVTGTVKLYLWDAAVPALPVIAQLLLAAFLAVGGYRRYRRR